MWRPRYNLVVDEDVKKPNKQTIVFVTRQPVRQSTGFKFFESCLKTEMFGAGTSRKSHHPDLAPDDDDADNKLYGISC